MSDTSQNLLFLVGGIAIGSLAVLALSKDKTSTRPALAGLAADALDFRDKAVTTFQRSKEDMADFMAEVEHARATRSTEQPAAEQNAAEEGASERA